MDNLGWGEIGAYGGGLLRGTETPRLDKLATEGMQLLNFNVEPQCTPSRSALIKGRHPIRSGTTKVVWGLPYGLVGWEKTMPELMSDGVDQMPLFKSETNKSAREGFPAYNGDLVFAYKWRNFKIHYYEQNSMFGTPVKHNIPRVHNLLRDPKEINGVYGGDETGTQSITWLLPAVTKELLKFQQTLVEEPPIKLRTP